MAYRCNQELILKYGAPGHQQIHTWEGKPRNFLYFLNFQNKNEPNQFLIVFLRFSISQAKFLINLFLIKQGSL